MLFENDVGQFTTAFGEGIHLVDGEMVGGRGDEVGDVFDGGGEVVEVLPIQGRDKAPVQCLHHVFHRPVASMFGLPDPLQHLQLRVPTTGADQFPQQRGRRLGRPGRGLHMVEKAGVPRKEPLNDGLKPTHDHSPACRRPAYGL